MTRISLNKDRCKRCGVCVDLCPGKVYAATREGYPDPARMENCTGCRLCELWCPDYALEVEVQRDGA